MWIVCGGGLRCGSTLQYNLVGSYVEYAGLGLRCGYGGYRWVHENNRIVSELGLIGVAKSHPVDDWGAPLSEGRAVGLTTYRNETEVRRSMVAKFGDDSRFEESERYRVAWEQLARVHMSYHALTENPGQALVEVCHALDLPVHREAVLLAVEYSSHAHMRRAARALPVGTTNPLTLLHHDHFKD